MGTPGRASSHEALSATVLDLIDDVAPHLREEVAPQVKAMRSALLEPLRIALTGRVSAGKSTLTNALLGRRVAPTSAGECTRVATWYSFGAPDRAVAVLADGSRRPIRLSDGLPETLGVDLSVVARIDVTLQSAPLRHYVLIDTPGLGAMSRPGDAPVRSAVLGQPGAEPTVPADAVLFLFRDVEKRDDMDFVRDFRQSTATGPASAPTVIGVLSHADVFGSGPWADEDPFEAAAAVARRMEHQHADQLTAVLPVAGLLAEAARTGRLTEADARGLAALAAVDRLRLQLHQELGGSDGPAPEVIARTMERAGPYVLDRGREVAARGGAAALQAWMNDRSGLGRLEELIHKRFTRRARPLRVARVAAELEQLSRTHARDEQARRHLQGRLEQFRLEPRTHRLNELGALSRLTRTGHAGAELRHRLDMIVDNDEPWQQLGSHSPASAEELRALARRSAAESTARATLARSPVVADAARVLSRSYHLIMKTL
jgi:hypothetical protein